MPANKPEKRLEISVTALQRAIIRRCADFEGVPVSEWMRNAAAASLSLRDRRMFSGDKRGAA